MKLAIAYVAALGLVGFGCSLAYPPAGPIAVGLLVWFDLNRKDATP